MNETINNIFGNNFNQMKYSPEAAFISAIRKKLKGFRTPSDSEYEEFKEAKIEKK